MRQAYLLLGLFSVSLLTFGVPACGGSSNGGTAGHGGGDGAAGHDGAAGAAAGQDGAAAGQDGAAAGQDGAAAGQDGAAGSNGDGAAGNTASDGGGDTATTDGSSDLSTDSAASADAASDGSSTDAASACTGSCNTLTNLGATVVRTVDAGTVPAMTGGQLQDGVYVLTAIVQYNNDNTAYSLKQTSKFTGNVDTWVSSINGAAEAHYTATVAAASNQLNLTLCCPTTASLSVSYTATATTFQNVDPQNPNRVFTFTKQ